MFFENLIKTSNVHWFPNPEHIKRVPVGYLAVFMILILINSDFSRKLENFLIKLCYFKLMHISSDHWFPDPEYSERVPVGHLATFLILISD